MRIILEWFFLTSLTVFNPSCRAWSNMLAYIDNYRAFLLYLNPIFYKGYFSIIHQNFERKKTQTFRWNNIYNPTWRKVKSIKFILKIKRKILNSFTNHREKVVVQANKTNLIVQGQGYLNTTIEWNNTANSTGYTSYSYSFVIFASKFTAYNISFKVILSMHAIQLVTLFNFTFLHTLWTLLTCIYML